MLNINLTQKELEIMRVLWETQAPMTATEIVSSSKDRTWKEKSIYIILQSLLKKNAIAIDHHRATSTNIARVYRAAISVEEYAAIHVLEMNPDIVRFIKAIVKGNKIDKKTKENLGYVINDIEEED